MNSNSSRVLYRVAHWPGSRWIAIGAVSAAVGGSSLALIGFGAVNGTWSMVSAALAAFLGVGVGGGIPLAIYLLLRERVASWELEAFANVRPMTNQLPLGLGGWAVDPVLADEILRAMVKREPRLVVECGSGWSTVLMARCLEELGAGHVVALEHEEEFAERTRRQLNQYGGSERAVVLYAPISVREVDGASRPWYEARIDDFVDRPVDVLLVDGPPADVAPESRFPAVPLLRKHLARGACILLDDGRRSDEARIAEGWAELLGVEPRFVDSSEGIWVFELEE